MKLYISGAMSGIDQYNFPKFNDVAAFVKFQGHEAVNPAEFDKDVPPYAGWVCSENEWREYLRRDILHLLPCDGVVVLDGWRRSKGARLEVHIALQLGMPIFNERLEEEGETVLEEAQRLIYGDRNTDYGHPLDDMSRTGRIWGAILGIPDVPAEKVALCMVGVKLSREVNSPKRDNRTDGAGYFGCVDMIHEERANRPQ
jgi:hypothetical protein